MYFDHIHPLPKLPQELPFSLSIQICAHVFVFNSPFKSNLFYPCILAYGAFQRSTVNLPDQHSKRKLPLPLPAVIHVKSSLAGVRFLSTTPLHAEICSGLSLIGVMHAFTNSEFVCALALCVWRMLFTCGHSLPLTLTVFLIPLMERSLSLLRNEGNRDDPFRSE